jgi:hypothetical protein
VRVLRSTDSNSEHVRMSHWMALPEDCRSELLKSYGRDEFANYHRNILKAVEIWRRLGVWRVPIDED